MIIQRKMCNFKLVTIISIIIGSCIGFVVGASTGSNEIDMAAIFSSIILIWPLIATIHYLKINRENEKINNKNQCHEECMAYFDALDEVCKIHFVALKSRRMQLIKHDHYGNADYKKWIKEVEVFFQKVFVPYAAECKINLKYALINNNTFYEDLVNKLNELEFERETECPDVVFSVGQSSNMNESCNYEFDCCEKLKRNGWLARMTSATGDQGIDIVANKNSIKAVFQCKYYSSPVGNKAVQEILAGKHYENADIAAVVTNNSYTNSAVELAKSCDVMLLHDSELENFDSVIFRHYIKIKNGGGRVGRT